MDLDRAAIVDAQFTNKVLAKDLPYPKSITTPYQAGLDQKNFLALFDSQCVSRHLDLLARELKQKQLGFYTIGSSGHEGNAAIASAFRVNDIAFLHYRSGAFVIQRAKALPHDDIIQEQILSLIAAKDDPISGGRHKVFGSVPLFIPPQTSTIASHLPKAVGAAFSINLSKTLKKHQDTLKLPKDSVVLCSFGDASVNHSTALGAMNAACWIKQAHLPLPLVFICEDNGLGISVPTPAEWIKNLVSAKKSLHYICADGLNLADVYRAAINAERLARQGEVVFLHLKTVRLLGHAGSDIESNYRTPQEIIDSENDDPLLHSARIILENKWLTAQSIVKIYETHRKKVHELAIKALTHPQLQNAQEIMCPIIPPMSGKRAPKVDKETLNSKTQAQKHPKTMAQCINLALIDIMRQYPNTLIFGEDVAKKGGVYHITHDLQKIFGSSRVFDTLLDEQVILGTAIGLAHNGFLPLPEIQFLAYCINAFDQIRGEAATLSFFSNGQYQNPMVIRIPSFGYQRGFGGHFHNDNATAFLREIPGIIVVCPSTPADAAKLLHESVRLAYEENRVVVFLEPIALYTVKEKGDNKNYYYPSLNESISFPALGIEGESKSKIAIISYGNGMHLSRSAAQILKDEHNIPLHLIDLRWLAPVNTTQLQAELKNKTHILVVDEGRQTGSLSETLITWMVENCQPLPAIQRITGKDCFIPLGTAWQWVLPRVEEIINKILILKNVQNE